MDMSSAYGSVYIHAARGLVICFAVIILILLLDVSAQADEVDWIGEQIGISELEKAAPSQAKSIFGQTKVADYIDLPSLLEKLWKSISGQSYDLFFSAVRGGVQLLAASFLAALCSSLVPNDTISSVGSIAVSLIALRSISSCAEIGRNALETIADYSHVLLPCLCMASTVGGGVTSGGAKYAASMLFLDGVISVCKDYLFPLLSVYMAVALTGTITDHPLLQSIGRLLKLCVKWGLVIVTSAFTLYLSLTGLLTGSVDAAAAKAAKTAISSALPVVGSILSDASSALISGAQMLCNSVGVMGMMTVLAVCAAPYLTLGSHYLVYQISGSAASSFGDSRIGSVIRCLGDIYGFLLGMVGSVSVMLFVSVISLMKAVTI